MKTLVLTLTMAPILVLAVVLAGIVACGPPDDKPPMTPDTPDPTVDAMDAGTPPPPSPTSPPPVN